MSQRIEIRGLEEAMAALDPQIAQRAAVRTINDMVSQGRTATSKEIRANYTIRAQRVTEYLRLFRLSVTGAGQAKLQAKSKPLPVTYFTGTRTLRTGVRVQIRRGKPATTFPHAFMRTLKAGHEGVFHRQWWTQKPRPQETRPLRGGPGFYAKLPKKYRLPLQELTTIGMPGMFDQSRVYDTVQALVNEKWEPTFRRNYAFYAG